MLSKEFRLRKKAEVDAVYQKGRSVTSSELALRFLPNSTTTSRIAVLVGKKISNKAVVRNRIRRKLREIARLNLNQVPAGFDLLIIARSLKLREMNFQTLTQEFLKLVARLPHHG